MREKRIADTNKLAAYLQLAPITIRKWTCQGKIPHYKIGKSVRFDLDTIDQWLSEQEQQPLKFVA